MRVTKRDGTLEEYEVDKIHKVVAWGCEDINGVSWSDIEMNANLSLYDKIPTYQIHNILVKSAQDLISEASPNYQYVAAKLLNMQLRKQVWGGVKPPQLLHLITVLVDNGIYDEDILKKWCPSDIHKIDGFVDHDRDYNFTYAGLQQLVDKYLVKDRLSHKIYETPQFAYILIAMSLFDNIKQVKEAYDLYSTFKINLPTPIMAGVRTPRKQFASCVLVDVDDTLDSIFSSVHAVAKYTANRAGIGLNVGRIRPINAPIRGGEVVHTGIIPYLKNFESAVKSTSQNGLRGGGGTVYAPWWHYEIDDILVLKNNAGTDDNRVRKLDYAIQFSELFYQRLIKKQDITLFNPNEVKGLYEAFGNNKEFNKLYKKYEEDPSIAMKRTIPAIKLAEIFARERLETGRIYSMNIDNVNQHGSWDIPVYQSNLCAEVLHPVKPINSIDDEEGEIGICILSALNLLEVDENNIAKVCEYAVNTLENIIEYQSYPVKAGETFTKARRSLGIGLTNFAGYLAKRKLKYDDPDTPQAVHDLMESIQWHLLNESCKLAKDLGPCEKFGDTKYSKGLLPVDWYKKTVDEIVPPKYKMDWESLREDIKQYGLRHSTMTCQMPCESSSLIQNSTNGIEPVRSLLTYKKSKAGVLKQLVPNFYHRRNFYSKAWDLPNNDSIIKISAVLQKFIDMGISTNLYYNYKNYEEGNIPLSELIKDQMLGYKYGLKNYYYANTPDGDGDTEKESNCDSGACAI